MDHALEPLLKKFAAKHLQVFLHVKTPVVADLFPDKGFQPRLKPRSAFHGCDHPVNGLRNQQITVSFNTVTGIDADFTVESLQNSLRKLINGAYGKPVEIKSSFSRALPALSLISGSG